MVFIGGGRTTRLIWWGVIWTYYDNPRLMPHIWDYLCWERDDALIIWC